MSKVYQIELDEKDKEIGQLKEEIKRKVEIAVLEGERDHKEIERLEKLVKEAFEEGWEHKDKALTTIENGWYESNAQKSLKEK